MNILYVPKQEIYPCFGLQQGEVIKIREDLPQKARDFLLVHETYHSTDKEKVWWKRELKANIVGLFDEPLGFLIVAIMSLAPYRLKYYWKRWKNKT
ncbi:MAG: hypothetical protein V1709_03860 [Planctomycetota bacterium]